MKARRPAEVVHVARITSGASLALLPVLSNERVSGPRPRTERTSAMCRRVRCLVAVNGDFFARTGQPVGGIISNGEVMRSPNSREQLTIEPNGSLRMGALGLSSTLTALYPRKVAVAGVRSPVDAPPEERTLRISGVNVVRRTDALVLYTPRFGPRTETNRSGVEVRLEVADRPMELDRTAKVRLVSAVSRKGNSAIPAGGAVLSGVGKGAEALRSLWKDVQERRALPEATIAFTAHPAAAQSFAGNPVLLRDGKISYGSQNNYIFRGRHPRTAIGYTGSGELLLVTVDGRQRGWSSGMTLRELAGFMQGLGAVYALNLDGGGSTTFVRHGKVVNRPSDRFVRRGPKTMVVRAPRRGDRVIRSAERRVALALVVVRAV